MDDDDPYGGVWQVGLWLVMATVGVLVLGTVFGTALAVVVKLAVMFGGLILTFIAGFTDVAEPPRGRISTIRSPTKRRRGPRRKRRTPKGAATRRRR